MILYHGSNTSVEEPKISVSDRRLDFGSGFYMTSSFEQAERWADHTMQRRKNGMPTVSVYTLPDNFKDLLNVKFFPEPNEEWLHFVVANRRGHILQNEYDLIIGPVANDQTISTIMLFEDGFLDVDTAIRHLKPQKLKDQYVIKTDKALKFLKIKEVKKL